MFFEMIPRPPQKYIIKKKDNGKKKSALESTAYR